MNIIIIGASGKAGKAIFREALSRNLQVTAIVRDKEKMADEKGNFHLIEKDIFDLSYDDLKSADVIVNAFGIWDSSLLNLHEKVATYLTNLLSGKPQTLIIVGGAGSLFIDSDKKALSDSDDFPESYQPIAKAMAKGLAIYRASKNVNWIYLSPAAEFVADGEKTGKYTLEGEFFTTNNKGKSEISYADYAIALIDIAVSEKYRKERISVRW